MTTKSRIYISDSVSIPNLDSYSASPSINQSGSRVRDTPCRTDIKPLPYIIQSETAWVNS